MKVPKSLKPIRIKYIQVNTKDGFVKYPIYKNSTYEKLDARLNFYATKHDVTQNMVAAAFTERTKKFEKPLARKKHDPRRS